MIRVVRLFKFMRVPDMMRLMGGWVTLVGMCVAFLVLTAGCETEPKTDDDSLVFVTHGEVLKLLASDKRPAMLVDARSAAKYMEGHIAGSISMPLADAEAKDPRLAGTRIVIVYGEGYTDPQPIALSKKLIRLRYEDVRTYREGLKDWVANGGATAQGESAGDLGELNRAEDQSTEPEE